MKQIHFPGGFMVGNDILKNFVNYTSCYGKNMVFLGGKRSLAAAQTELEKSFVNTDCQCTFLECGKMATLSEIEKVAQIPKVIEAEVLCAVGGGSCMDIVRTVGNRMKKTLVMIPTTASSDAPCSRVSVFYSEDGSTIVGDEIYTKSPDLVLVDTKLIAHAPARQLASGMGDALATIYEAATCKQSSMGCGITETAMMMSKLCREIVMRDGLAAYRAVERQIVTPQLENVVEANCFLSGVGGTNSGCAAAHGIGDYLCCIPSGHSYMHGERVFVGLMVQMILEQYPEEELLELMSFGKQVKLPVCLSDLGVTDVRKTAYELAAGLQNDHFMVNLSCDYSEHILAGAFCYADHLANHL